MEIQYKITKLDEVKYWFNFDCDYENIDIDKIYFLFKPKITPNPEHSEISVEMEVKLVNNETPLVQQAVRASYLVKPYEAFIESGKDKKLKIHSWELIDTFAAIAIGALRGILAKNLYATPLKSCVLPLISIDNLHKMLTGK